MWFNTHVFVHNKRSEISRKKRMLEKHLIPYFRRTPLNQITKLQVESFKARLIGRGLSNKTVNNYLTVLNTCLAHAEDWLEFARLPRAKLLKTPPDTYDFLTTTESELLLSKLSGIWQEIVLTALKTGLRLGELRGLRWQDINLVTNVMVVNHSWCKVTKGLVSPKSNKARSIPLAADIQAMLHRRQAKTGYVFATKPDRPFDEVAINREIRLACKRTGLRPITCHTLRHTFASHLALAGVPLVAIQQLLGHSSIDVTMRYAHLTKSSLQDAIRVLEAPPDQRFQVPYSRQLMGNDVEKRIGT